MTERMTPEQVRAAMRGAAKRKLEDKLARKLAEAGLPEPVRQYPFAKAIGRRWRFDFCWPERRLAVEVDGGIYSGGRHVRGKGYEADCEKLNSAALQGWMALRVTAHMVSDGRAVRTIKQAFET
jgi:very-short-patch-repair endonuclease